MGLDAILGTPVTEGATAGSAGTGGAGGSLPGNIGSFGGGGGGAGWYGGGGDAVDSGAGGSNYIAEGGYDVESVGGANPAQGFVDVAYGTASFPSFTGRPRGGIQGQAYSYQFQSTSSTWWP